MSIMISDLKGFSEACYNSNSFSELLDAYSDAEPDYVDCETWSISAQEWLDSISQALGVRMREFLVERRDSELIDRVNRWAGRPDGPDGRLTIDDDGDVVALSGAAMSTEQLAGFFMELDYE